MENRSLKTPPLLLGAALVFWGWQTGMLPIGIGLALVFEASRVVSARWEFSQADLDRIWNLSVFLFLGALLLSVFGLDSFDLENTGQEPGAGRRGDALMRSSRSVLLLFQWLPMIFAPIALTQTWGRTAEMPLSTFSWFLRRQRAQAGRGERGLNLSFSYLGSALLAASAANLVAWFFPALSALLVWALWSVRPRRFSLATWALTIGLVVLVGYAGQAGLRQSQRLIEGVDTMLLSRFGNKGFDVKESRTSLGALGKLKMSGRIVLRVETEGRPAPELLREASYTLFKTPLWYNTAARREFQNVPEESDATTWKLQPLRPGRKSVGIWRYLEDNAGLLAVPAGTVRIEELPAFSLATNELGAIKVYGPGLINYVARYDVGPGIDSRPADEDRDPLREGPDAVALQHIAAALHLSERKPQQVLSAVAAFFRREFSYSTWLPDAHQGATNTTPLAAFLLEKKAGHCEYFATATVLLLRQAGVPARYATGYVVQERSGAGYVVRQRHAHAWCLAWLNGAWQDFDTTPADSSEQEQGRASMWEPIRDFWSRMWFEFSKWRFSRSGLRPYFLLLLVPPLGLLIFRVFFRKQWNRLRRTRRDREGAPHWPGSDSEFYLVERRLAARGQARGPEESAAHWLARIEQTVPAEAQALRALLGLHNRLRFDPAGLAAEERDALREQAQRWLEGQKTRG